MLALPVRRSGESHQLREVSLVQHAAPAAGDHAQCQHGHGEADQEPEGLLIPVLQCGSRVREVEVNFSIKNLALDQFLQLENGIPISSCSHGFQLFLNQGKGQCGIATQTWSFSCLLLFPHMPQKIAQGFCLLIVHPSCLREKTDKALEADRIYLVSR
jgi:hypothetical protein